MRDGATLRASGMFYKEVVQLIIILGSETWVVTKPMLQVLKGFFLRVARRISGNTPYYRHTADEWIYSPI